MINKQVSSKAAIAKIIADLDLKDDNLRLTDMQSWIGEAIEKIGAPQQFEHKVSGVNTDVIKINKHQAVMPDDLNKLKQVAYSTQDKGPWQPMRVATGSFNLWDEKLGNTTVSGDLQYSVKPGFIVTNVPDGYLKLSYDAICVDAEGYPLIPDNVSYIEACYWYVVKQLQYPAYLGGRLNREVYYDIRRSWNFYCKQAYGEAMMPSTDEMHSVQNQWNRLVPILDEKDTFYENVGTEQRIYNHNI